MCPQTSISIYFQMPKFTCSKVLLTNFSALASAKKNSCRQEKPSDWVNQEKGCIAFVELSKADSPLSLPTDCAMVCNTEAERNASQFITHPELAPLLRSIEEHCLRRSLTPMRLVLCPNTNDFVVQTSLKPKAGSVWSVFPLCVKFLLMKSYIENSLSQYTTAMIDSPNLFDCFKHRSCTLTSNIHVITDHCYSIVRPP